MKKFEAFKIWKRLMDLMKQDHANLNNLPNYKRFGLLPQFDMYGKLIYQIQKKVQKEIITKTAFFKITNSLL